MRFQRLLNEMAVELSVQEALQFAVDNCKPFLHQIVKKGGTVQHFMFSGRTHNAKTFTRAVQKERHPMDTPPTVHKMLDAKFQRKWGVKARSQSIFCTGSPTHAEMYGHPFMIFPMGRFTYLYHPKVKDLFNHIRFNVMFDLDMSSIEDLDKFDERMISFIAEYKNRDLVAGIKSGNEIMVQCKEYFAVSHTYYWEYFQRFFRKFGIVDATEDRLIEAFEDPANVMRNSGLSLFK